MRRWRTGARFAERHLKWYRMEGKHTPWLAETQEMVARDFELDMPSFLTEEELLEALTAHVAYMMERQMEYLLSALYRMDVAEQRVNAALHPDAPVPPARGIAVLIVERQRERLRTKRAYRQSQDRDWFDF